eukprot:scaffold95998_cov27-Tisochrysis_lutea.AAC.1
MGTLPRHVLLRINRSARQKPICANRNQRSEQPHTQLQAIPLFLPPFFLTYIPSSLAVRALSSRTLNPKPYPSLSPLFLLTCLPSFLAVSALSSHTFSPKPSARRRGVHLAHRAVGEQTEGVFPHEAHIPAHEAALGAQEAEEGEQDTAAQQTDAIRRSVWAAKKNSSKGKESPRVGNTVSFDNAILVELLVD